MNRALLLCAAAVGMLACQRAEDPQQAIARLSPEQRTEVRRTIMRWLECEDCTEGEREQVVEVGAAAIPTLASVLQEGPSPAQRESALRALRRGYQDLQRYGETHPESRIEMTEDEYVQMYLDNYVAMYRVRAAQALSAIGGPHARQALVDAQGLETRADVRAAIQTAIDSLP